MSSTNIILDAGCGTGETTKTISETFTAKEIYGFDVSPESIEYATKNNGGPNTNFFVADASLPWDSLHPTLKRLEGQVSLIWSNHVLQNVLEKKMAVKNLGRLCKKPGGRAYVNVFFTRDIMSYLPQEDRNFISNHIRYETKEEQLDFWKSAFLEAGFANAEVTFETQSMQGVSPEDCHHFVEQYADDWKNMALGGVDPKVQEQIMGRIREDVWAKVAMTKYGETDVQILTDKPMDVYYEEVEIVAVM